MPSEMSLLDGINSLRSVRKFKPDPIPEDQVRIILDSASKAASGSNTQPWEFVIVRDARVKARLKEPMLRTWLARLAGSTGMSPRMREDRKSTRLNSSHSQISYAVFCLKKKKHT